MRSTTDRGRIGSMWAPTSLDDEHRLDFVEGARAFALRELQPRAEQAARTRLEELEAHERPRDGFEARDVLDELPDVALRHRVLRTSQEMIWAGVQDTYHSRADELLAALAWAESRGPGSLSLDPQFDEPSYLVDYHLQPGGYHTDPLSGFIYHYGTKLFWMGANDDDQQKERYIAELPVPVDGRVERVLDLACSVGQSTTAFKDRFPEAEVWGIDVSEPLLRYAHLRAVEKHREVHFAQMAAEHLRFGDGSIDLVYGAILFHEVPIAVGERILDEVARVLRPGGVFVVGDLTPVPEPVDDVWRDYLTLWDTTCNGEPYEYAFRHSPFTRALEARFDQVTTAEQSPATTQWVCRSGGGR